jgi:hypothetical protein
MNGTETDALTRGASRRNTLLAFGGAALAATLARAFDAEAKKHANERNNKQDRKKANARCKAQVGQCNIVIGVACAVEDDPAGCEARVQPCCDFAATCNVGSMLECVLTGGV